MSRYKRELRVLDVECFVFLLPIEITPYSLETTHDPLSLSVLRTDIWHVQLSKIESLNISLKDCLQRFISINVEHIRRAHPQTETTAKDKNFNCADVELRWLDPIPTWWWMDSRHCPSKWLIIKNPWLRTWMKSTELYASHKRTWKLIWVEKNQQILIETYFDDSWKKKKSWNKSVHDEFVQSFVICIVDFIDDRRSDLEGRLSDFSYFFRYAKSETIARDALELSKMIFVGTNLSKHEYYTANPRDVK